MWAFALISSSFLCILQSKTSGQAYKRRPARVFSRYKIRVPDGVLEINLDPELPRKNRVAPQQGSS